MNLPCEIAFDEIQVGDTIRSEFVSAGMRQTRMGVAAKCGDQVVLTSELGVLANRGKMTFTLLDRPTPRIDEPTRLGSVVVAGRPGNRCFFIRVGAFSSGPWHWRDAESDTLYRWDDLTDPRPATEREIEECEVIEP